MPLIALIIGGIAVTGVTSHYIVDDLDRFANVAIKVTVIAGVGYIAYKSLK